MSEPLTNEERKQRKDHAERVLTHPDYYRDALNYVSPITDARECLRYEKTLQAKDKLLARWQEAEQELRLDIRDKDATIAALVTALQKVEWGAHPNYFGTQYCPSCHMARIAGHTDECKLADALEATDAS